MKDEKSLLGDLVVGRIKWFDPVRGFGFLADAEGGGDVFLHANVLRSFGQSSIGEGALVEVMAVQTGRGRQAAEVLSILPPPLNTTVPIAELVGLRDAELMELPLLPARVKWFDRNKGFGFANVFGRKADVFLHLEVLRRSGFVDLLTGEAIGLRVFMAGRGMVAGEIAEWEKAVSGIKPEDHADAEGRRELPTTKSPTDKPSSTGKKTCL